MVFKEKTAVKQSVILEVTNDDYEFVVNIYQSTQELAEKLNITSSNAQSKIAKDFKNKKTKFIRVRIDTDDVKESK